LPCGALLHVLIDGRGWRDCAAGSPGRGWLVGIITLRSLRVACTGISSRRCCFTRSSPLRCPNLSSLRDVAILPSGVSSASVSPSGPRMTTEVSHGRGGAGNISVDDTPYIDGEVVRTGVEGSHGDGAYSAGRGGAGNIGDVGTAASKRKDQDIVPEVAVRPSQDAQGFHTGRGGAGNEHTASNHEKRAADKGPLNGAPIGLADRLKEKLFNVFKK
ncbi:Uncharacterized protein TPAR_01128, partial [Tolypocladium paradoxum]